jgi:hypothetical protein
MPDRPLAVARVLSDGIAHAASVLTSIEAGIDASSFSGLLTRVEISVRFGAGSSCSKILYGHG